jgi:hypothetical protein
MWTRFVKNPRQNAIAWTIAWLSKNDHLQRKSAMPPKTGAILCPAQVVWRNIAIALIDRVLSAIALISTTNPTRPRVSRIC